LKLFLLPGLDGTGELFDSFVSAFSNPSQIVVCRYPADAALGYSELAQIVLTQLPCDEPFVLLGESFSGPIAVAVAATQPSMLRGLVLVNTFLTNPRPVLLSLCIKLPDQLLTSPPDTFLKWMLRGAEKNAIPFAQLQSTLTGLSPKVVRSRLVSIANVNVESDARDVRVPVCIIQSISDLAVSKAASNSLVHSFEHCRIELLTTSHFLLQTLPKASSSIVEEFAHGCYS